MVASYALQYYRWLRTYYGKDSALEIKFSEGLTWLTCRAVASLIEALDPPRLDHLRIDRAPAVQRLMQIFPIWQAELENPDFRPKQKDLMKIAILSFRRATSDLLSDLQKRVLQAFAAPWADGWVRAAPSCAFDTYLSNATFYDILSMRLGRQVFQGDTA